MKARLLIAMLALSAAAPAAAVHRCTVDGDVVFQDQPCPQSGGTVGQLLERQRRHDELHRLLDDMAARGVGMITSRAPPAPQSPPPDPPWRPQTRGALELERKAQAQRAHAEAVNTNRRSTERLNTLFEEMTQACGGPPRREPDVGMTDKAFRECTVRARFGGIEQVVAVEREGVPLRLYLFGGAPALRVYSIGGVVTAVRH